VKSLHLGVVSASLADPRAGTTIAVLGLARHLAASGQRVSVFTVEDRRGGFDSPAELQGVEVLVSRFFKVGAGLVVAPAFAKVLRQELAQLDCLLVQGFWLRPFYVACRLGRKAEVPVILSPHGMFSDFSFANRGAKKRLALALGYRRALKEVSAFHATSSAERHQIERLGLHQPVHIVSHGVDLPPIETNLETNTRTVLFLGRLHPVKGLPLLLESWADVAPLRGGWSLEIAGPDERGHRAELEAIVEKDRLPRVRFLGPLDGNDKVRAMRRAGILVLPSWGENFGMVVAEALALETPVITTDTTPWSEIGPAGCGWCVPPTSAALTGALLEATARPLPELRGMGKKGREHVRAHFSWPVVAEKMLAAIEETVFVGQCRGDT